MKTIQITCIMEKQLENRQACSDFFYEFVKEVNKLAEQHGLIQRLYYDVVGDGEQQHGLIVKND